MAACTMLRKLRGGTLKKSFPQNVTIVSLDDNQLQLRSTLLSFMGITRKPHNPIKRFGPVDDLACSVGSGAVITGNWATWWRGGKLQRNYSKRALIYLQPSMVMHCPTTYPWIVDITDAAEWCVIKTVSPFTDDPALDSKLVVPKRG